MPITRSAKKALRVSFRKKIVNDRRVKQMKDAVKKVEKAVVAKVTKEAGALLSKAYAAIDKAQKQGVIKKNTASRKKARIAKIAVKK